MGANGPSRPGLAATDPVPEAAVPEPQRRPARVRSRRLPLHRPRRRRQRRRPAGQRAEPRHVPRQDPAHRPEQAVRRHGVRHPARQPVRRPAAACPRSGRTGCATRGGSRFDKDTGDLWIADVGQGKFEEIDFAASDANGRDAAKGSNFGWNRFEGNHDFDGGGDHAGFVFPVFEYTHSDGCSVTGGYRYRGTAMTGMEGAYLFADYCNNTIRVLSFEGNVAKEIAQVKADPQPIVSFGEDAKGELYVLAFDGSVSRLDPPRQPRPTSGRDDGASALGIGAVASPRTSARPRGDPRSGTARRASSSPTTPGSSSQGRVPDAVPA